MFALISTAAMTCVFSVVFAFLAESFFTARIPMLGSFAGISLSHNPGIAYGMNIPSPWQELLIGVALILVMYAAWRSRKNTLECLAFGLILGGALGNIIDRIPDGLVTDYFSVGTFPVFNVADSSITIGAGLLLWETWMGKRTSSKN